MKGSELIDRIRGEMAAATDGYTAMMGEMMTEFLRLHPQTEIGEGRTLKGAFDHLKAEAKKKAKGGCYAMPPKEIFDGMMQYYGQTPDAGDMMRCFMAAAGEATPPEKPEEEKLASADDAFDLDLLLGM